MSPTALNGNGYSNGSYTNGASHSNGNGYQHQEPVDPTAERRQVEPIKVNAPNTTYSADYITSKYTYHSSVVEKTASGGFNVTPIEKKYEIRTERKVPKTGLMLVGWGGNNGSTLTAAVLANRNNISWNTKEGVQSPNYIGSLVRASTLRLGVDAQGQDVYVPFSDMLPMVHPNDLVLGGWDISSLPLDQAMRRGKVLEWDLQRQVAPEMSKMKPLPSVYYADFIAANQDERADNVIPGNDKKAHLERLRADIREFKANNDLDKVIVLWTANTERYADLIPGVNDTADNLLKAIETSHDEVSPSTLFAVASILEGVPFINGAPQNTFVPGCIELAEKNKAFIGGDDFKSGQTRVKSAFADFLINAGLRPLSVASYNHLGNNDGMNLNSQKQFRSKEISKSSVIDDMVHANHLLYDGHKKEIQSKAQKQIVTDDKRAHPDHCVVIKYMPAVGDNKRAMDEYYSELAMGGRNMICMFNECQDSLLAMPIILDLAIIAELLTRVTFRTSENAEFEQLYSVLGLLSYMLKAPLARPGQQPINSLTRQRAALDNFMRSCLGLQPLTEGFKFCYTEN